jgi:hypothetical protein
MNIEKNVSDIFVQGTTNLTTVNTSKQITTVSACNKGIRLKAPAGNGGIVYVGDRASVSAANGYPLSANESVFIAVEDPSRVYGFNATVNDTICWIVT